jgi:hypothetical protein
MFTLPENLKLKGTASGQMAFFLLDNSLSGPLEYTPFFCFVSVGFEMGGCGGTISGMFP